MHDKLNSQMQGGDFGGRPPAKIATFEIPPDRFVCIVCHAMVPQAARVLPHMSAYVCLSCAANAENAPIGEAEVVNKSFSPWSEGEVALLNDYQLSKVFLPFVCNSEHLLIAKSDGFICPECVGFRILWVYSWMLSPDWKLIR